MYTLDTKVVPELRKPRPTAPCLPGYKASTTCNCILQL